MATTLIKDGYVVDGSGDPAYDGSLLIEGAKIKAVFSDTPEQNGQPAGKPKGLETVFINRQKVVEGGSYINGVLAGRVLR